MKRIDSCPVTHVSLHMVLKELASMGTITPEEVYRPGIGLGTRYTYNGEPLQFRIGFIGRLDWLEATTEQPLVFSVPHDIVYVGKTLITFAKSL